MRIAFHVMLCVALCGFAAISLADDGPSDRNSLSQILERLEKSGYHPIVELEHEDGMLEIEAYENDKSLELRVDLRTGDVRSKRDSDRDRRPPADALPLSEVVQKLHEAGYTKVREVDFDRHDWKIEVIKDRREWNLRVDPLTAEIKSEHKDD